MPEQRVLIARRLPDAARTALTAAGCVVDELDRHDPAPRELLLERVRGAAGLIATLTDRVDDELLDAAGDALRVVANYAVGFDNIDVDACRRRGVRATNTPGVLTDATADITWALILAAARHVVAGDRMVRTGEWTGWAPLQLLGLQLSGATLGIVGAGRIGTAVARRSAGFDMRVVYSHPRTCEALKEELGATRLPLDDLLQTADIVSLHVPMRPENHHLIDARRLALMQPTALLINTARGAVIDEAALVDALRRGRIAGAGLDVYEHEPRLAPGLADLPNVVILPHLGSATTATRAKMAEMAADNVVAVLQGGEPPNPIA